jgi:GWxTD domain-containing protein
MNYKAILSSILILSSTFAQPGRNFRDHDGQNAANRFIFFETITIPSDEKSQVYFSYKIPYSKLVFEKNKNVYAAALRLSIEVTDTNSNFIKREIREKKVSTTEFDETNSNKLFSEGLIGFELGKGDYDLLPIFTDLNSDSEVRLEKIKISTAVEDDKGTLSLLITNSELYTCDEGTFRVLTNYEGKIPFSNEKYDIVIPINDKSLENAYVTVINIKDTVFAGLAEESFTEGLSLKECEGKIILKPLDGVSHTKYYILSDISNKLKEGNVIINVSEGKDSKPEYIFKTQVKWFEKPLSLMFPEHAIEDLKYIEADSVISNLLDENKSGYLISLFNYWKKFDPTPETEFNELMEEYYSRIDYAQSNFSSISVKNGAETDRGKVFIMFGKPQKIERFSNDSGKIVETWIYENPHRKFTFVDKNGMGDFSLLKG